MTETAGVHPWRETVAAAAERGQRWATRSGEMAGALVREWRRDRVGGLAAEVAFFGLLSLFPALLATAAALGWLDAIAGGDVAHQAEREVVDFLRRVLTDEAAGTIDAVQQLFAESDPGVVTIGLLVSLWAGSRGFVALVRALQIVYDVEERRSYVRLRAVALALGVGTVLVLAAVLAMLVLGPLLGTGRDVAEAVGLGGRFATFWDWFRWPVVVAVMVTWATTVLHVAANTGTAWRRDLPGAVLAAAAWAVLSTGLRAYLSVASGRANDVLGTLGGSLIVLLWLYLIAIGILVGGELNAVLAARSARRRRD